MIGRPATEQIVRDVRRELLESVAPAVGDPGVQVTIQMLDSVLRNVAIRAAHEIAWMRDETGEIEAYARDVIDTVPNCSAVEEALAHLGAAPRDSLHLDDVVETYERSGEALSRAIEAVAEAGHTALWNRAAEILDGRLAREEEVMDGWVAVGRG
jgi:hypothetical protein